jgi:hypothetical protein
VPATQDDETYDSGFLKAMVNKVTTERKTAFLLREA